MLSSRATAVRSSTHPFALLLPLLALAGCGGDEDAPTAEVSGRVFSAYALTPLSGVRVATKVGESVTNAEGEFTVLAPVGDKTSVHVEAAGHAAGSAVLTLRERAKTYVEARLVPFGAAMSFDAGAGGNVALGDAAVAVPAGALASPNGTVATGSVEVAIAVLDPRKAEQLRASPGPQVGEKADGTAVALSSAAMMDITAKQGGEPLGIAQGRSLTVDFPAHGKTSAAMPLYSYRPSTGKWHEEGVAMRMDLGGGKVVYRAQVTHLSWWGIAEEVETACVAGCARLAGVGAPDVSVSIEGISSGQLVTGSTDADGCFVADVGVAESFRLRFVGSEGAYGETVFASPAAAGGACTDLGTTDLVAVAVMPGVPLGAQVCTGDVVVDPEIDPANCGGCGIACGAAQACIAGGCEDVGCGVGPCPTTDCSVDSDCATDQHCIDTNYDGVGTCGPAVSGSAALLMGGASAGIMADCECWSEQGYSSQQNCLDQNIGSGISPSLTTEMVSTCIADLGVEIPGTDWTAVLDCASRATAELASCYAAQASCSVAVSSCWEGIVTRLDRCDLGEPFQTLMDCLALPNDAPCTLDAECRSNLCEPMEMVCLPPPSDADLDGHDDIYDNCPAVPNDQRDYEFDGLGDACDPDDDGDGFLDGSDNCPRYFQVDQLDTDMDGIGDPCDREDMDGDLVYDWQDNCPGMVNPSQSNLDGDMLGDECDPDDDADGVDDVVDLCPTVSDGGNQVDTDMNGLGDACDVGQIDTDRDGWEDASDLCPSDYYDPAQWDADGDGLGDACDPDDDEDGFEDVVDTCPLSDYADQTDTDGDGVGDFCDWDDDGDLVDDAFDNCPSTYNPDQLDTNYSGFGDLCE